MLLQIGGQTILLVVYHFDVFQIKLMLCLWLILSHDGILIVNKDAARSLKGQYQTKLLKIILHNLVPGNVYSTEGHWSDRNV